MSNTTSCPGTSTASASPSAVRSPHSPHSRNSLVDRGLDIQLIAGQCRYSLKWGCINAVILSVVLFDLSSQQRRLQNCPFAGIASDADSVATETLNWWRYHMERAFAVLLALSICYNFGRLFYGRLSMAPLRGTVEQRRLLRFDDGDASFVTDGTSAGGVGGALRNAGEVKKSSINNNTLNMSGLSWHSSFNDSNRSFIPPGWLYNRGGSPTVGSPISTHTSFHNASAQHHSQQLNTSAWSTHNASLNATSANTSAANANASFTSPYRNYNKREIITDAHELQKYLKSDPYGNGDGAAAQDDNSADVNAMNTLRSYCNNAAHLLKESLYQISPITISPGKALSSAKDDLVSGIFASLGSGADGSHGNMSGANAALGIGSSGVAGAIGNSGLDGSAMGHVCGGLATTSSVASASEADESYELQRLSANGQLTQSIYNLRGWLAVTIVQRLDAEIEKTNRSLSGNTQAECRGFTDVQIGKVGLERLRKTAEVQPLVAAYVPMLPRIVDFVQMSSNQEYLVQRIRDLAKGCVLADYRWNAGGAYGGVAWDEHLHPTDAQIMFHLFCTYLDGQLPPLPQPGGRPFYARYVVNGDKRTADEIKAEVRNKSGCAILCTNAQRPRFNFITTRTIHNSVHDRNNLFNVIVEFLVYMRTHNEGMLESINLGRSGINLLRVIGD